MDQGVAALLAGGLGVFGALAGAVAGALGAIRGARLSADRAAEAAREQRQADVVSEHSHWLRQQRRDVAVEFSAAIAAGTQAVRQAWKEVEQTSWDSTAFDDHIIPTWIRIASAGTAIDLIASDDVIASMKDVRHRFWHWYSLIRDSGEQGLAWGQAGQQAIDDVDKAFDRFAAIAAAELRDPFLRPRFGQLPQSGRTGPPHGSLAEEASHTEPLPAE
jgi:hypothetical protein